ncbi:hypothetical protein [Bacillus sp. 71mf]|nr:hypothetical protein [Bacillus sp. 71mf]
MIFSCIPAHHLLWLHGNEIYDCLKEISIGDFVIYNTVHALV